MIEKVMGLIELARRFDDKISVNVRFASNVDGVDVYVITRKDVIYNKMCYLDWNNAEERLDHIREDLEKILKEVV